MKKIATCFQLLSLNPVVNQSFLHFSNVSTLHLKGCNTEIKKGNTDSDSKYKAFRDEITLDSRRFLRGFCD